MGTMFSYIQQETAIRGSETCQGRTNDFKGK